MLHYQYSTSMQPSLVSLSGRGEGKGGKGRGGGREGGKGFPLLH